MTNLYQKLEINMHHLPKAMQYRQAPWAIFKAIFTKLDAEEGVPGQYLHAALHGWANLYQKLQISAIFVV